jgi:hypothetical protein
MHQGSCQCGSVRYEIEGELGPILFCHCGRCRKANGAAFQAAAGISPDQLHLLSGQDAMVDYESSPGVYRVFCGRCGSPLFSKRDAMPELLRLRLGTLDTPVTAKPTAHIFVAEKAEWYDICDDLPQYAERP